MIYALYNKTTGTILRTGSCSPDSMADRYESDTIGVLRDVERGVDATHQVVDGELVEKPQ